MSCEHCCYSCTAEGEDMSKEVFDAAIKLCEDWGSYIILGGGEPTLHPKFREYLIDAIVADAEEGVFVITNGSIKKHALLLAKLAKKNVLQAELSRDEFHDIIDPEVVKAFDGRYRDVTNKGTRNPVAVGRALTVLEIEPGEYSNCACEDFFIKPDGTIRHCGCDDSPIIGNVFEGIKECEWGVCYKDAEESYPTLI